MRKDNPSTPSTKNQVPFSQEECKEPPISLTTETGSGRGRGRVGEARGRSVLLVHHRIYIRLVGEDEIFSNVIGGLVIYGLERLFEPALWIACEGYPVVAFDGWF